jgi:hypothetical protein
MELDWALTSLHHLAALSLAAVLAAEIAVTAGVLIVEAGLYALAPILAAGAARGLGA